MKPKYLINYKSAITALIAVAVGGIFFVACKKDSSVENTGQTADSSVSSQAWNGSNQAPRAKAGNDQTIALPTNTANFDGSGSSDADGSIASYLWTKETGPDATIASPAASQTAMTGLTGGSYRFRLTVTDNKGATGTDTVHLTVTGTGGSPTNQAPTVNAGTDQTITSPASSVSLAGTASDADGTIASYLWTKVSGTGGTITTATAATTTITSLTAGTYVFSLKATDNLGATATDNVTVTGTGATTNQAPTVSAGADKTITLPANSVSLTGTAADADGTVASYLWAKVSGSGGTITTATAATTTITGLTAGSYVFSLKATDNQGATAADNVTVTVLGTTTNTPPTVNAGTDQTITLPANSVSLAGTASVLNGTIASYVWTKVSGSGGTITTPSTNATTITGLLAGNYTFRLTVTSNTGATATDDIIITVNSAVNNTGYTLVYSSGYDDVNSIDPFGHGQWGSGTQASHLSTTILNSGAGSFKSVPANVSSGIRSEVQYDNTQSPLEGIVEYDVYYDNFFSDNGHSLQWHPTTSGGSGTGLYHKGGKLQFVTVKSGTSGTNVGSSFTVSTKVWHHIKLTYKFGSSGYIKVELDGVAVVPQTNVQMGDGSAPYLKVGVNMWVNQTSVVYYDNLKVYKK